MSDEKQDQKKWGIGLRWTQEDDALLEKLVVDGSLSFSQAAKKMNFKFTRNALIGRAARLGIKTLKIREKVVEALKTRKLNRRVIARSVGFTKTKALISTSELPETDHEITKLKMPPPKSVKTEEAHDGSIFLKIEDLKSTSCRWPVGNPLDESFRFCGADSKFGSSYCVFHRQIAYVPPRQKVASKRKSA